MARTVPRVEVLNEETQDFMDLRNQWGMAIAPGDFHIATEKSNIDAKDVDLTARVTRNYNTPQPGLTAAMDTVTEGEMGEAAALNGFLGVIHAGLTAAEQKQAVRRVKLSNNGLVDKDPITASPDETLGELLERFAKGGWRYGNVPVKDVDGRFAGLLSRTDFDLFDHERHLLIRQIMAPLGQVAIADPGTSPDKIFKLMQDNRQRAIPLVDPVSGNLEGLHVLSDVDRIVHGTKEMFSLDNEGRLLTAAAVPTDDTAFERIDAMADYLNIVFIDTSTGDGPYGQKYFKEILEYVHEKYQWIDVVIGNITSPRSAAMFADMGADGIKIGQGVGSICSTSEVLGVGMEQYTAVHNCKRAVYSVDPNVSVIADGGMPDGATASKILTAADSLMFGAMVAGTAEAPGEPYYNAKGEFVKRYRGMGSLDAQKDNARKYNQESGREPLSQGYKGEVPFVGGVARVIQKQMFAVRQTIADTGASNIEEFHRMAVIWQKPQNSQSGAHDITVIGR